MAISSPVPVLGQLSSLADETRARILLLLDGSELSVSEICQVVQLPQSTVSRHLRILSREGWLTARSEGPSRHYRVSPALEASARALWDAVRGELSRSPAAEADRARAKGVLDARAERSRTFFSSEARRWDTLREELFGAEAFVAALRAAGVECELLPIEGAGHRIEDSRFASRLARFFDEHLAGAAAPVIDAIMPADSDGGPDDRPDD